MPWDDELWPGSGIAVPADWREDGLLGGVKELHPPSDSVAFLTNSQEPAIAGDPPVTVRDSDSLTHPAAMPKFGDDSAANLPEAAAEPSPGAMSVYRLGGNIGKVGGKAATYGAGLALATSPGYLTPYTAPLAAAGTAAGGVGVATGETLSTIGTGLQLGAGLDIGLETGNWRPLTAAGAPVIAGAIAPLPHFIRAPLEERLQDYIESGDPDFQSRIRSGL